MFECIICKHQMELDDVVVRSGARCVCLRCYLHETGQARPMPAVLRNTVIATLAAEQ